MTVKRSMLFALVAVLSVALIGCAGKDGFQSDLEGPEWYINPPKKDGSLFAAASAVSSRQNIALRKAELQAKRQLASSISSTLQGQRERYIEELGDAADQRTETKVREQYQDLTRELVDQELQGTRLVEKAGKREKNGNFRAYVLIELTMDDFTQQLSDKEELRTRFNAKQFEEDMEQNLDKMGQNG